MHHARKNGPAGSQGGQGLRGSGDFHAWIDSALYVRRTREQLAVTVEHRSAPATDPFTLSLVVDGAGGAHLDLMDSVDGSAPPDCRARLLDALDRAGGVATRDALRGLLRLRNERLGVLLADLAREGTLSHDRDGWRRVPVPPSGKGPERTGAPSDA